MIALLMVRENVDLAGILLGGLSLIWVGLLLILDRVERTGGPDPQR